ncbi:MAG: SDR family oxidoreductase [Granulosicoccus sp.]|nr:SDR family oxidoreductase [Granulosicoccus sp.]
MSSPRAIYPDLAKKLVIVTGGASGIGASIVEAFIQQGSQVAFFDIDAHAGESLAQRLGDNAHFYELDLTDIESLQQAFSIAQKRHGRIDVLVNNAANDDRHQTMSITPAYWRERLAVNLDHVVFASQCVIPGMQDQGSGVIINIGSIAWRIGLENGSAYVAAKAAIQGLTHSLARELGPDGIRVNCLLPGAVYTQRQLDKWLTPDAQQIIRQNQCLAMDIQPEDIAVMALLLASDASRAMTNQTLTIDAGWT